MPPRFFCETPIAWSEDAPVGATLVDTEAHHLRHVLRLGVGDRVTLFDGGGAEYLAEVTATSRRDAKLSVLQRHEPLRERPAPLVLGVALPKGDRQRVLVEKLTELGVAELVPLVTERGVAAPKPSAVERLRRGVIEASKQCRRNVLMRVSDAEPLEAFLAAHPEGERLFAHPDGAALTPADATGRAAIAIGPEGGFTATEAAAATAAGWTAVSLGPRILRVETAAVALAATRAIVGPFG
ncbi:MAG: RsmE family RNA methyltransferase [Planctomycetota bacterium]